MKLYYPVFLDSSPAEKPSAVYEVYIDTAPLNQAIATVKRTLIFAEVLLSVLLVALAWSTSLVLRRHNDELALVTAKLEIKADKDGLTELYNHRHFQSHLEREIRKADRYKKNLSLIMVDLDFFKLVNDEFGHQKGDLCLRRIKEIFDSILRDVDYSARYGGEEFVAVLPETDGEAAMVVAQRLRKQTESVFLKAARSAGKAPRITLSCGVADYPACADTREGLIAAADSALLFSKRRGRNCSHYFRQSNRTEVDAGDVDHVVNRLSNAGLTTIKALVDAVDKRDSYDTERTGDLLALTKSLGSKLQLGPNALETVELAAQFHDIGKLAVPDRVLNKKEPLTSAEKAIIRNHPEAGARIVKSASRVKTLISAVLHHHENWDGTGYPDKLKGKEIPVLARVLRVVDSYHAMISDRPYRKALSRDQAICELRSQAGREFDPEIVENFIKILGNEMGSKATTT